ncbi:MAG: MiaB/RimO family radical SAM methylthiotransferase, partial [Clostridia bacterium]|nr:MiaB/RimO family radical SAM methylthiotransferase [Clostridia bacterium]
VMEAYEYKNIVNIILTGCLPQRYMEEISGDNGLTEVSAFVGNQHYHRINEVIDRVKLGEKVILNNTKDGVIIPSVERVLTTPLHYGFLKIAEGCDNCCTYCAIPKIRGRYISAPHNQLLEEVQKLIDNYGTRELILVAQDVTRYGSDRGGYELMKLLDGLEKLDLYKIRLMYCYPELVSRELVDRIAAGGKIARYIDMPMQHIDDDILKKMNRKSREKELRFLLEYIKSKDISVRSTFILGFPTESERQFEALCNFIAEYKLDNAGFFAYSKEEGTAAYSMKGQIKQAEKKRRLRTISAIQSAIMTEQADRQIGNTIKITYDGIDYNKQCFFGHSEYNHPEIDKKAYFTATAPIEIGMQYDIKITGRSKLDLKGYVEAKE